MTLISLSIGDLLIAAMLVVVVALLSWRLHLGSSRQLLIAAVRSAVQLMLLGFVLKLLFESSSLPFIALLSLFMLSVAGYEVMARQRRRFTGYWGYGIGAVSMFISSFTIMLLTLPIIYPLMVTQMQFNPIWFGVILTILIEVAQVTPPVGFNLYVIQHVSGQPITTVARYSLPFILILILGVVLLYFFPEIALYLPQQMVKG